MVVREMQNLREIINGKLLPQYNDKRVSIIGLVDTVAPNGLNFTMKTVDEVEVKVNLRKPAKDLRGYVEVHGKAQGKTIACEEIIEYSPEESDNFDAAAHDTLCSLLHTIPDLWKTHNN